MHANPSLPLVALMPCLGQKKIRFGVATSFYTFKSLGEDGVDHCCKISFSFFKVNYTSVTLLTNVSKHCVDTSFHSKPLGNLD